MSILLRELRRPTSIDRDHRTGDERGGLQRVADLSDTEFGVHPAHTPFAYLPRDKESEVRDLLAERRPVLVVGHSMAGKTRMCAELARREFPDWPVFILSLIHI